MDDYNPKDIEKKWQKSWEESGIFKTSSNALHNNKYYILPQLPYPSGNGLHVGHAEVYTACDILARYKRMKGKKVLQVIGWDSFGLPAENYAIKTNIHPRESTEKAIDNFRLQIKALGISVDWDREVSSHMPSYYKWTQWFFLLMYNRGLAYRKKQSVNWCTSCKTVLANDQVKEGQCERCESIVVQRYMEQWYLKTTEYAERLLEGLDHIDWPEETKKRQRDWIGKSEGAIIQFQIVKSEFQIKVFTTRPDTLFGATYIVLAPEGEYIKQLKEKIENWSEVEAYILETSKKTELERQTQKEKTGIKLDGMRVINIATGEEISVWVSDYVFATYGTGAIMSVPAHDERDFEFANKFGLPIKYVVQPTDSVCNTHGQVCGAKKNVLLEDVAYVGDGKHINSKFLDNCFIEEATEKMIQWLEEKGIGNRKVQYKLRDWSVSRQRFWGAPVPMLVKDQSVTSSEQNLLVDVLHLHALGSNPDNHFLPWLRSSEEKLGIFSLTPVLPHADYPIRNEWFETAQKAISNLSKNVVVTARSLSAWTALELAQTHKMKKLIMIAPTVPTNQWNAQMKKVVKDKKGLDCIFSFVIGQLDFDAIRQNVEEIVVFLSTTDPYIPLDATEHYIQQHFPVARIIRMRDSGHFDSDHGYITFPLLLAEVTRDVNIYIRGVDFDDLPVKLPNDVNFKPTGQSPLIYSETFQNGVEEKYGTGWKREIDTLDTFMCSSWYYYRYLDPKNDQEFASPEALKTWMPVDFYLGGPEHVNGHLLYSRFFTKVLYDSGYIDFDEPFIVHRHQGFILGSDGRKMSKRWGNVINPTDVVNEFGADTCRMYEMFMGPLRDDKIWDTNGIKGIRRFLERVWCLREKVGIGVQELDKKMDKQLHLTIKKVGEDIESLSFNTAIAKLMELVKELNKIEKISADSYALLITLLSPFAPHIAEELWEQLGNKTSIVLESWPEYDKSKLVQDMMTLVVQVNGKVRADFSVSSDISEKDAKAIALANEKVQKWLDGREPKKVIYVKGKLVSVVV